MLGKRLIKSNDAGGGGCTNTVDLYNPFPDGGGVALYQLNGDATDVSGNYDGTASNVTYGTGQFGQAGVFNGSSSQIEIAATSTTPVDVSQSNYSISLWAKTDASASQRLISKYANDDAFAPFFLANNADGTVSFAERGGSGGTVVEITTTTLTINDNNWHHIVVTKSPTATSIYIDNSAFVNNNTHTQVDGGTTPWRIGRDNPSSPSYFAGSIDQVRIFSRALRPYEVEALYTEEYCTPTIVPSEHFNTVTYTGNGSTQSITGVGFQPDFVWLKKRSGVDDHFVFDSIRGAKSIYPNLTNAEDSFTFSFDTDGFTVPVSGGTNGNGDTFVAWNFKAGGAAVTNTDGTITSQVSANTEAGFSIVKWTGTGSAGSIGHGLNDTPSTIIIKRTDSSQYWFVNHISLSETQNLYLNTTDSVQSIDNIFTSRGASNFGIGSNVSPSGGTYIAYCFAEVEGFSNFGSYVGTGSSVTQSVVTGFEPAWVMIKDYSAGGSWWIEDNKRGADKSLKANTSDAETTTNYVEFLENGFTVTSGLNDNSVGSKFIYMAFAADPTAVEPSLEDSFNTVLFTPTTSTSPLPVTGVGFQPDLVWAKYRNGVQNHYLFDSIRGGYLLRSNTTDAELTGTEYMQSFDNDGFTTVNNLFNRTETDSVVAWNWKGAEIPAINSNGSIPSVVSANPAAGFSIVSWTGNGVQGATIGNGLNSDNAFIIVKNRSVSVNWGVWHKDLSSNGYLTLNTTNAEGIASSVFPVQNEIGKFAVGTDGGVNVNNQQYIAYCFAEVAGFSKFGSYTGNGLPLGPTIDCGFEPAFIIFKRTDSTGDWFIYDNKRDTTNPRTVGLYANLSDAEYNTSGSPGYADINFLTNGFSMNASYVGINGSGGTFIYMAFANQF